MKNWIKVCLFAVLDCLLVAVSWFLSIKILKYDLAKYLAENLWYVFFAGGLLIVAIVNFALKLYSRDLQGLTRRLNSCQAR